MPTRFQHLVRLPAYVAVWAVSALSSGCGSNLTSPDATLLDVQPPVVCGVQKPAAVQLGGTGFTPLPVETLAGNQHLELPKIILSLATNLDGSAGGGTEFTVYDGQDQNHVRWNSEQQMSFDVYPGLAGADPMTGGGGSSLPFGLYDVSVQNPDKRRATKPASLDVVDAPHVTNVSPSAVCNLGGNPTFAISGSNFLQLNNELPTVTFTPKDSQLAVVTQTASSLMNCVTPPAPSGTTLASCTDLLVTVPAGTLMPGIYTVTVTNPGGGGCTSQEMGSSTEIAIVTKPTLTDAEPQSVCSGGAVLSLTGSNFFAGGTVFIKDVPSISLTVSQDGTSATATFSGPLPVTPAGTKWDVSYVNAPGCSDTLGMWETVTTGPLILFVDPPAVPNLISIQATVYAAQISPPIVQVQIAPTGTANFTTFSAANNNLTFDPAHPGRALITLPKNLPTGLYDVYLNDNSIMQCQAILSQGLKVVDTPTLTVSGLTPPFGSADQDTAVVVSGTGFVSTPRVYLNPSGAAAGALAQEMAAVTFQNGTTLNAVARGTGGNTLTPGPYDVLVINPDGSFGIKTNGFTVTDPSAPPPIIDSIAPSSVIASQANPVKITGSGFRSGATLSLSCFNANNMPVSGATTGTTTVSSAQSITSSFIIPGGFTATYCTVRVTNSDGTFFDFSAIGVTNSSAKLTGFTAGANMTVGRRALAAVAGRPTAVSRFVYALGGDNGNDNAPFQTVEATGTGLDGTLGKFFTLTPQLPSALSFAGAATIGHFIYLVGGFNGSTAQNAVYRAEILNPLNAPQFTDVDVNFSPSAGGLPAGLYIYRLSVVLNGSDANNPGGETLAGDPFPIQIPTVNGQLTLTLTWKRAPNAAKYRIYRLPKANDPSGSELLLDEVPDSGTGTTQVYTDDGTKTPAAPAPLPIGTTGAWRTIATLKSARIGAGVVAGQADNTTNQWFLYAMGGNSGTVAAPVPENTVEFLPITISKSGTVETQDFTTWTLATPTLKGGGRWQLAAVPATAANNSNVSPASATFLYAGGGSTTSLATLDNTVEVARIQSNGDLGASFTTVMGKVARPGYTGVLANNFFFTFGGFASGPSATNLCEIATLGSATSLGNFSSLAMGNLKTARALQATALESAFIYQLGGAGGGLNTAQSSTEQTIW